MELHIEYTWKEYLMMIGICGFLVACGYYLLCGPPVEQTEYFDEQGVQNYMTGLDF